MRLSRKEHLLLLVPYPAMLVGLYLFHSAWLALALYHALMIVSMGSGRAPWARLRAGFRLLPALALIAGGALVGPLLVATWPRVASFAQPVHTMLQSLGLSGPAWPLFVLYYGLVHPGIEEAYWRGYVAPRLEQPWLSDLAYAGYHALVLSLYVSAPATAFAVISLAGSAALWRLVDRKLHGLAVPWLSHLAADASFIAAVWVLAQPSAP